MEELIKRREELIKMAEDLKGKIQDAKIEAEKAAEAQKVISEEITSLTLKKDNGENVKKDLEAKRKERLEKIFDKEDAKNLILALESKLESIEEQIIMTNKVIAIKKYNKVAEDRAAVDKDIEKIVEDLCKSIDKLLEIDSKQRGLGLKAGINMPVYASKLVERYLAYKLKNYMDLPLVSTKGELLEMDNMAKIREVDL